MERWLRIQAGPADLAFDPEVGNIRRFSLGGHDVLHTAHWVGTPSAQAADSVIDAHLAGDFLAAPFGTSDLMPCPPHGWSANSRWHLISRYQGAGCAGMKLMLDHDIMGARVTKDIRLCEDHPVLYQTHVIEGGPHEAAAPGGLTFAHHPMIRVSPGDAIATSPKRAALTPEAPLEPAHILAYPERSTDLTRFPAANGGTVDLSQYPRGSGHEDFVTLVEAEAGVGWTAVTRAAQNDIVVVLKDSAVMPVTMLWISNGGRDYAPWDGRHDGVLGIEDGCTAGAEGHKAALGDNAIAREGVPTALILAPNTRHTLRHAIAVLPRPQGFDGVKSLTIRENRLVLIAINGSETEIPFEGGYFSI
ncbi:MAG: hypothetical protein KJ731_16845 [Alphaproteobacteria bacterium]|nr:hypothetical protein [Alphaproteobacteria bacterium]MBU1281679.1 hypothetical protein [Alphaproteobacteria bacterium]MBU1575429.1 hypothetical protein [Alphaproteobacteria bacterium]MBU1830118.1 hypothetical protein [Alphaproteobacteria bacterium]MBU2079600.1 hypothetical protein [Alphaproteobacteria bacterium]